ncbi:MAG TPA: hypothetical protein DDX98_03515 [Bacteroidales bacterium]|jgi:hypothetical protein|nr:hypothetical protein [Bacteroidales bacterium]
MANFAELEVTFTGQSFLGSQFQILVYKNGVQLNSSTEWVVVTTRTAWKQVSQGPNAFLQSAYAQSAVNIDLDDSPAAGSYTIDIIPNGFKLIGQDYDVDFVFFSPNIGALRAEFSYTPAVLPTKDFQIISDAISAATTNQACTHLKAILTSNGDGVGPFTWISPAVSSETAGQVTSAELARQATNQVVSVTIQDSETDNADPYDITIPRLFTTSEINQVVTVTNQSGIDATVTVFMVDILTFANITYSLDGINFQSSNVFSSVIDGTYTLYINDGYGCIITQEVIVDIETAIVVPDPYAFIPIANSIRFVQDTAVKYKTLKNTLYRGETYYEHRPFYAQKYENGDGVILTQFRSNYDGLSARVLNCDGNIVDTLTIEQKSNNTSIQDKRDAIAFNLGNGQTGIYFTNGNIYTPGTEDIIDTFDLSGNLPEWGVVGNTVVIGGTIVAGSFVIKQVKYNSTVQANILVIDNVYDEVTESVPIKPQCTYNRLPYETFEFGWDLDAVESGIYTLQLLMTDSSGQYDALTFNTDYIQIESSYPKTNFIEYDTDPYSGIDYSTGYVGKIRVKSLDPYANLTPGGEQTIFKDSLDETKKLKEVATMEGVFFIQSQPRYMVEKIRLIFQHKNIQINGEYWINIEGMETVNFNKSALKNINIPVKLRNYLPYANDNINIDGINTRIITSEGAILQ